MAVQRSSTKIRELVAGGKPIVGAGAIDPMSAMILERLGIHCLELGGTIVAYQRRIIDPLLTPEDILGAAESLIRVTSVPLIADIENGFGDSIQTERTIKDCIAAGVAGAHIEDSRVPRRLNGHDTISMEAMVQKIKAAQEVKLDLDPDFFLVGRTESGRVEGGFDEARRRLHAYVEAGVDGLMPLVRTPDEFGKIGEEFGKHIPLVYLAGFDGSNKTVQEIADTGYQFVFYIMTGLSAALNAFSAQFEALMKTGRSIEDPFADRQAMTAVQQSLGLDRLTRREDEDLAVARD